jgi:UPF0755 protein
LGKTKKGNKTGKRIVTASVKVILSISFVVFAVIMIAMFTGMAFDFARELSSAAVPEARSAREVSVTIPVGSSTQDVANVLRDAGLTSSVPWFRLQSRLGGYDGLYKSGTFSLNTNMSDGELMSILTRGILDEDLLTITIPEGWTAAQIGSYLEGLGLFTAGEFRNAMNNARFDYDFLHEVPDRNTRLEGYLFPDSYFVLKTSSPEDIISKMLVRFLEVYNEEKANSNSTLSMDEVIIRASIIEAEIRVPSERAACASVIQNRLNIGMPLQMDATVQYALGERKTRLMLADLEVDSPYNTYRFAGLPLGPISNPGRASIHAALNPANTNYYYYVVNNLETGSHEFTVTYEEFLAAKARYQTLLN